MKRLRNMNDEGEEDNCKIELLVCGITYEQQYGTPPSLLANILSQFGVDGIIDIEFFLRFRIQIKGEEMYYPPQGI